MTYDYVGKSSFSTLSKIYWQISVELIVNDLAEVTGMLPNVSYAIAKNLEQKLFCDFEITSISSDGANIACNKVILSGKLCGKFLRL